TPCKSFGRTGRPASRGRWQSAIPETANRRANCGVRGRKLRHPRRFDKSRSDSVRAVPGRAARQGRTRLLECAESRRGTIDTVGREASVIGVVISRRIGSSERCSGGSAHEITAARPLRCRVMGSRLTMVAILLVVVTLASSAAAEDAWVLWAEQKRSTRGGLYERTSLDPVRGYSTL